MSPSREDEILDRLDLILATLRLAFAPQLEQAGAEVRNDAVSAAILDAAEEWVGSTELQEQVANRTKMSKRLIRDRLRDLASNGALSRRGDAHPEYRRTGLI